MAVDNTGNKEVIVTKRQKKRPGIGGENSQVVAQQYNRDLIISSNQHFKESTAAVIKNSTNGVLVIDGMIMPVKQNSVDTSNAPSSTEMAFSSREGAQLGGLLTHRNASKGIVESLNTVRIMEDSGPSTNSARSISENNHEPNNSNDVAVRI